MTELYDPGPLDTVIWPCGMAVDPRARRAVNVAVTGYRTDPDLSDQDAVWTDLAIQVQDVESGEELGVVEIPTSLLAELDRLIAVGTDYLDLDREAPR